MYCCIRCKQILAQGEVDDPQRLLRLPTSLIEDWPATASVLPRIRWPSLCDGGCGLRVFGTAGCLAVGPRLRSCAGSCLAMLFQSPCRIGTQAALLITLCRSTPCHGPRTRD